MKQKSVYTEELAQRIADSRYSTEITYHVSPGFYGGWRVRRFGSKRATRIFPTVKEAIAFGKKYAVLKSAVELVIFGRDLMVKKRIIFNPKAKPARNAVRK